MHGSSCGHFRTNQEQCKHAKALTGAHIPKGEGLASRVKAVEEAESNASTE
jgi:hypothetical protein